MAKKLLSKERSIRRETRLSRGEGAQDQDQDQEMKGKDRERITMKPDTVQDHRIQEKLKKILYKNIHPLITITINNTMIRSKGSINVLRYVQKNFNTVYGVLGNKILIESNLMSVHFF